MKKEILTEWEIEMKSLIDKKIEDELKELMAQEEKTGVKHYTDNPVNCELYRNSKKDLYEREYRDNYTLSILSECGFDVLSFDKTWMCICERSSLLLKCIQDKIDGFYHDENGERIPSKHKLDLDNIRIKYKNGVLKISDNKYSYEFMVDEGQIVYVNGENIFNLPAIPTTEKEKELIKNLMCSIKLDSQDNKGKQKKLEYPKKKK